MATKRALVLELKDNVANVLEDVEPQDEVSAQLGKESRSLIAIERIPFGFKMAIVDIPKEGVVFKYGEAIGIASQDIKKGSLVHVHNIGGARGRGDLEAAKA